ncbi:MAG TPA: flagellar biosynthesis protein FlhF [Telluria sp.]|nr:flagellar biosynthesis protein FlhF [Telluria sp.]
MNVKKFVGQTSRDALRKVREAIGPDAVILSNRVVDGSVEILAVAGEDVASIATPSHESEMAAPRPAFFAPEPAPAPAPQSYAERRAPAAPAPAREPSIDMAAMTSMMSAAIAQVKESAAAEMSGMMSEIRAMRGLMENQLAELSWGTTQQREPHKAAVLREMLGAGFSAILSRYLIDKLPPGKDAAESLRWIRSVLARNISALADESAVLDQGGVFALVGPTGVGKTTTTAKLAARCVMRHGPDKLALITTDAYRIGGHEQLRIYGKILGVMVHSVKDEADLRIALKELRNKHTVLIDTIGMSQRDQMVAEQVAMLNASGANVQRLLCLNSTSTAETLNEVVRAYHGSGVAGCIMTKLDEAASIGNVLDVLVRHKLQLYYISNGQRVPEDLHLADRAMLVDRAFRAKRESVAQLRDADLPVVMAHTGNVHKDRSLRGVALG